MRKATFRSPVFLVLILVSTLACTRDKTPLQAEAPFSPPQSALDPFVQNTLLAKGVNLGNALEAPREGDWGVVLEERYFQLIKEAGFTAVRIPTRWSAHAKATAPFTIDKDFFDRVEWAVRQALQRGLAVVLNMHHYEEIMQDPAGHRQRFLAMWDQIARHFRDYPAELFFELLNEPSGNLSPETWNAMLVEGIQVVRSSNPYRILIVGPCNWNAMSALESLRLPEGERGLIVTVHYYNPFQFTHQGAEWVEGSQAWLGTTWSGTPQQKNAIELEFVRAKLWAEQQNRPLFLGEFGAYSKADMNSRALWTAFVARQAEKYGMSWCYWEFCAGFGLYDRNAGNWLYPLLRALIP
ncbi:MAG: glycoside hydrolase family 5 protein [candidate division KSB1 bacterium]|nr:glycoside hydrolase family 5 protein [candidate division KSB1 bacterium]